MDDELVRRAGQGDHEAFDRLVRTRIDRLYGIARRVLHDPDDAEDAVQQALWSAWRDLPGLKDPARFDAWVYRLVVRSCYRTGRRARNQARITQLIVPSGGPTNDASGGLEARDELERAFRRLSTSQRAVVVLHLHVGLPLVEIAAILDEPAGTVRSRLHHALRRLREAIETERRATVVTLETER